jgi:hypothetical protein
MPHLLKRYRNRSSFPDLAVVACAFPASLTYKNPTYMMKLELDAAIIIELPKNASLKSGFWQKLYPPPTVSHF